MSWLSAQNGTEAEDLNDEVEHIPDDGDSAITYESDTDKKVKKKKTSKSSRLQNSPYLSNTKLCPKKASVWRSLKGTGQMHTENPMAKVPRQLWLASLKQGNGMAQPLRSDIDTGQAWANTASSTPDYLKEALGMKKPKYSRSSSNGYIPGTPDYKEKEDMYDQILDLKKTLQAQKSESDIMKTKLRRLEEENSRKDRQIEQLLDPSRSSEFTRSLVDKKSDNSLLVNTLKQKILKLEKQCKEKDNALSKLQTELKTTSLEEMKIAMEAYYEEIQRLQILLAKAETTEKRLPLESKESQKRQKVLNSAVMRLSKQVKELQEENQSLKADLDRALAQSPTSVRSKGYSDWSKQRLVRRISELEKKLENQSPSPEAQIKTSQLKGDPKSQKENDSSSVKPDLNEECERLRNLVKKIKEDRAALQILLGSKETELKTLKQEKTELEKQLQRLKDRNEESEEIRKLNQKIKKLEAELEDAKHEKELTIKDVKKNDLQGSRPGSGRSDQSAVSGPVSSATARERQRKQEAADLIQKNWRRYKSKKENAELEVAEMLQAAIRGHLARQKYLSSTGPRSKSPSADSLSRQDPPDDGKNEDDSVSFLQATFRAHLARTKMLSSRPGELKDRDSPSRIPKESARSSFSRRSPNRDARYSLAGGSSGDLSEDLIEELTSEEEEESIHKRPGSIKGSPQRLPLGKNQQPVEDSDDSDGIIIVSPSRPTRRKDSGF
ncbi:IQ domain-containing protein E [Spea bombifrons]|uniref:IQ domain-containing protein E n=1 Tax=Spea bombifrons TaxID=233779 RepID=UPI002348FA6A|nr:IQ domain-containing protein E [Spea bombifrons]XP_053328146.1 IQ domain-containing protein E [Spea bombifrons]